VAAEPTDDYNKKNVQNTCGNSIILNESMVKVAHNPSQNMYKFYDNFKI